MTLADLKQYQTPRDRLLLLGTKALQKSGRSAERAVIRFINELMDSDDPELVKELVGADVVKNAALGFLREVLRRDMDGGGIGLRHVNKTGSDAAAEEACQMPRDPQWTVARPSAPQSQNPATTPVGGGHIALDTQKGASSPTSHPAKSTEHPEDLYTRKPLWSPSNIAPTQKQGERSVPVTNNFRSAPGKAPAKAPYVAPKERVSAAQQLKAKNIVAASILTETIVRGKPLGEWRKEEALELSETLTWDGKVLKAFADPLPPGALVKEYITVREAENIMKTLEANRAA